MLQNCFLWLRDSSSFPKVMYLKQLWISTKYGSRMETIVRFFLFTEYWSKKSGYLWIGCWKLFYLYLIGNKEFLFTLPLSLHVQDGNKNSYDLVPMARKAQHSKADIEAQQTSKRSTAHQNRWKSLREAQKAEILGVLAEGRKKRAIKYKKSYSESGKSVVSWIQK